MLLHPGVQKKARDEINAVISSGMLPSIEDEQSLPYVTATVLEVMRWRPAPLGE
jgi:cytochrome P450